MTPNITSDSMAVTNGTELKSVPEGCVAFPLSSFAPWNHPEDLVSYKTQQTLKEIVDVYVFTPLFFMSVPLNIINMMVFRKHGIQERINLCLFVLSLSDVIVMTSQLVFKLDRIYATITNTPYKLFVAKHSINNMVHTLLAFIHVSGFMSTLIALERCLCVVNPLKAQGMLQTKSTAVIIAVGHALIIAGFGIIATRWKVVCMFDPLTGYSVDAYYSSQFYLDNSELVDALNGIVFGILLPGVFVLGVSTATVVTTVKLRQMTEWRHQTSTASASDGSATKDVTLTRMLVGTNILFVVCTTPVIFQMVVPFVPELSLSGKYYNTVYLSITIHQLCSYINSSFNFFVYYFFGTKFRTTVKHMFSQCLAIRKKEQR